MSQKPPHPCFVITVFLVITGVALLACGGCATALFTGLSFMPTHAGRP